MSRAPAIRWWRRWRRRSAPAPAWPMPPASPTSPPASSSARSAPPSFMQSELAARARRPTIHAADKILPRPLPLDLVARWRRHGLQVGFTNGCFDLLHPGHVALLGQASAACDRLVVGLNSDASAARLKGPTRRSRAKARGRGAGLAGRGRSDRDLRGGHAARADQGIKPDLLVKGADYRLDEVVGARHRQKLWRRGDARRWCRATAPPRRSPALPARPERPDAVGGQIPAKRPISGSIERCSRAAAMRAKRRVSARRRAGPSACAAPRARAPRRTRPPPSGHIPRESAPRKVACHGEIEAVGQIAVVRPFAVGAEIGYRTFDLDDHQFAVAAERQDVGAPPVGEREFCEARISELSGRGNPACEQCCGVRRASDRLGVRGMAGCAVHHDRLVLNSSRRTNRVDSAGPIEEAMDGGEQPAGFPAPGLAACQAVLEIGREMVG